MRDLVSDAALSYIRKGENKKKLWKKYSTGCTKADAPFSYFMAGAPGSGKTEIVNGYFAEIFENYIIADADEIRKLLPLYNGNNASSLQKAASKGMDVLYDNALQHGYSILVDGTFALDYEKCRKNIQRSAKKNRGVAIFYLYTNPRVAWTYAKKREYKEGRKISMLAFTKAFFKCRKNINRIKNEFGSAVYIVGMKSNYPHKGVGEIKVNISNVDEIQKIDYTYLSLLPRLIYANILLQKERFLWKRKQP